MLKLYALIGYYGPTKVSDMLREGTLFSPFSGSDDYADDKTAIMGQSLWALRTAIIGIDRAIIENATGPQFGAQKQFAQDYARQVSKGLTQCLDLERVYFESHQWDMKLIESLLETVRHTLVSDWTAGTMPDIAAGVISALKQKQPRTDDSDKEILAHAVHATLIEVASAKESLYYTVVMPGLMRSRYVATNQQGFPIAGPEVYNNPFFARQPRVVVAPEHFRDLILGVAKSWRKESDSNFAKLLIQRENTTNRMLFNHSLVIMQLDQHSLLSVVMDEITVRLRDVIAANSYQIALATWLSTLHGEMVTIEEDINHLCNQAFKVRA